MITKMPTFTIRYVDGKWEARISDQAKAEVKEYERYGKVTADTPEAAYWKIKYHFETTEMFFNSLSDNKSDADEKADKMMQILMLSNERDYYKRQAFTATSTLIIVTIAVIASFFL